MNLLNKLLFVLIISCLTTEVSGQINYYQEIFHGGVTANGYNTGFSNDIGTLSLFIEPLSTIKKAYLFTTVYQNPIKSNLFLNSNSIVLDPQNAIPTENIWMSGSAIYRTRYLLSDVTEFINPSINNYTLIPPQNQSSNIYLDGGYSNFYLLVLYENQTLPVTTMNVFINNKNASYYSSYSITNINPLNLNNNIALTINATEICDTLGDGSFVKINNQDVGLIGGMEDNTNWYCTGSKGSFSYQNNLTLGIGNDTADDFMAGSDVLANIESYLSNNYSFDVSFTYQQGNVGGSKTNPIHQLFLVYTSTCDTFTVTAPIDTSICYGETLQLNVSGGQMYEWFPSTGLSCSDCPDPVFTADSSMYYTVRIWNNDSCSVVRPVRITVLPKPQFGSINVSSSDCGTANGTVNLTALNGTVTPVSYTLQGGSTQSDDLFDSLPQGSYFFYLEDGNGCISEDTLVFVPEMNNTVAAFTLSPDYGTAPLTVQINNTSQNATDYLWSVNGTSEGSTMNLFYCDTSGIYNIQLIAWQYDPSCADTAFQTITVIDQLIIPTAFTPDNDGVNDFWELPNIDIIYPDNVVSVYNRWGEQLFRSEKGKYINRPWNGKYNDEIIPVGSYYFIIETHDQVGETFNGIVSIIR